MILSQKPLSGATVDWFLCWQSSSKQGSNLTKRLTYYSVLIFRLTFLDQVYQWFLNTDTNPNVENINIKYINILIYLTRC